MTPGERRFSAALFVLTFVAYAWFFGGGGWNQNANFDLTRAIVERGTFAIDGYRGNTYDVAFHDGHTYANKAPGLSLLAVPVYAVSYWIERAAGVDVDSFVATTLNQWLGTVAVCAGSGAWLAVLLALYLRRRAGATGREALAIAFAIAFGTIVFPYATVFFAHVPAACLLFWAFTRREQPVVAGALLGAAVLCNYAVLPAAVLMTLIEWRRSPRIIAGAAPFAAALLAYQTICFGSPFRTAVQATSGVFLTPGALFGVFVAPRLGALYGITFSPFRGLFFLSPVLLLALAGLRRTRESAIVVAVFAAFLLVGISFNNWDGGSAIGPRYILPSIPFLALPLLVAMRAARPLFVVLALWSMAICFVVTAVNPLPSRTIRNPVFAYELPLFVHGWLKVPPGPPYAWKEQFGHVSVSRHGADEFVAFARHPRGSVEGEWASFNLGETFAPGSLRSLVPIVLWICGGFVMIARKEQ